MRKKACEKRHTCAFCVFTTDLFIKMLQPEALLVHLCAENVKLCHGATITA